MANEPKAPAAHKPETEARLHFIQSIPHKGEFVAVIADAKVLGEDGVSVNALRQAQLTNKFNLIRARKGIHFMNRAQLEERVLDLKKDGACEYSLKNLVRAHEVVCQKSGLPAAPPILPADKKRPVVI